MTKKDVVGIKDISDTPLQCQKFQSQHLTSLHFISSFHFFPQKMEIMLLKDASFMQK